MTERTPRSRREFLKSSTLLGTGLFVSGARTTIAGTSPNEKLNVAVIGPGGRGAGNLQGVSTENIVALCDVDARRAASAFAAYPQAKVHQDFRKMLDAERLDAVVVSTPDHIHAHASILAMRQGLHCYCEKPLTHSVWEARLAAQTAKEYHVKTQMGTQIHAGDNYRRGRGDHSSRNDWARSACARLGREGLGGRRSPVGNTAGSAGTRLGSLARSGS